MSDKKKNKKHKHKKDTARRPVYTISPSVFFEEEPISEHLAPTRWFLYGVALGHANLIMRIAELSGRLPARRGHEVTGYAHHRPSGAYDVHVEDNFHVLWDGDTGEDGLFTAREIEVTTIENKLGYTSAIRVNLDEPLDDECAKRIECLLIVGLTRELEWAAGNSGLLFPIDGDSSRMWAKVDVNLKNLKRAVKLVSCGVRSLGVDIPSDAVFRYNYNASFRSAPSCLTSSIAAARMIAENGCAGKEAERIANLIHEMYDVRAIWQKYADEPLVALDDGELARMSDRSGITGFVRSYLADGVPIEDILA